MTSFASPTTLAFPTTSGPAVPPIQVIAPNCTILSNHWSYNTLGQNACVVAAYLQAACSGGSFTLESLNPGFRYIGPFSVDEATSCACNPVAYNLLSACGACQGGSWITWSEFSSKCSTLALTYPNPIPSGTLLPQWALLNTPLADSWNATAAELFAANELPDIEPGSSIGTSSFGVVGPNFSPSQYGPGASTYPACINLPDTPSLFSTTSRSGSNTGVIAGGVVLALAVIGGLLFYLRRRPQAPSAEFIRDGATPPSEFDMACSPKTPATPMKFYDPNDPSTFPGYQNVRSTQDRNLITGVRGDYHGLPMI